AQSAANIVIEKFYKCEDKPKQKVHLMLELKTFTRPQVIDITCITPIPLGNQLKLSANIDLENRFSVKGWQHLVTIEDDLCRVVQMYMGPFAYDIEVAMGIPRGTCPLQKAQNAANFVMEDFYKCENVPKQKIDLSIKLKTFSHPQIIDLDLFTPIPLGNQFKVSLDIDQENIFNQENWGHLFSFDDDLCRFIQMYLGLLAYDIQVAMGIPRGSCPLPKKNLNGLIGIKTSIGPKIPVQSLKVWDIPIVRSVVEALSKRNLCEQLLKVSSGIIFCQFGRVIKEKRTWLRKGRNEAQSAVNFIIEKCYNCENITRQTVNLTIKPKTFTHPQIADISLITPIPLGDHLRFSVDVDLENKFSAKNWERLVTIEDDYCRARRIYLGPLAYDMETSMGIVPRGVCPVPKAQSAANFVIDSFYKCKDVPNQKINLIIKPKTFSRPQVLDLTFITPIPLGEQVKLILDVELENKFIVKNWQRLVTIEDDFCRVIQMYVGPLAHDVETAMGIPRGICPVPKGNYHAINYTIDFNLFRLQAFPFGKLRITNRILEKRNRNVILCAVTMISNMK
ncbi:hypothetical protein ILUMI_11037, partial [Ignelater luminosus]